MSISAAQAHGLGRLELSDFTLFQIENAVRESFEARRGKHYNALRALNAMALCDVAISSMTTISFSAHVADANPAHRYTYRDAERLVWDALKSQMEPELTEQFRFLYCIGMARRRFRDPPGVVSALEQLIPMLAEEYRHRAAEGTLARKGGVLRWCLGLQEVGGIEELLGFARQSLFFAEGAFDEQSQYPDITRRLRALIDALPR